MSASVRCRALIIGASISGLAAAVLLRRAGWDVDVFERSETELRGRGAGIATHPELDNILKEAGAATAEIGVTINRRIAFSAKGEIIGAWPLRMVMTSWDRLHGLFRRLLASDCHHLGRTFVAAAQDSEGVTAQFADGSSARGELLVGADGFRSAVRAQYAPNQQPIYAGYVLWRGMCEERALPPEAHRELFHSIALFLAPGAEVLGYPIPGPDDDLRPGHQRFNWGWYQPADEAWLADALTDASGVSHLMGIPPPLLRDDLVAAIRNQGERFLPPQFLAVLRAIRRPFLTPIYDFGSAHMAFGRVALIGDAAFLARPHVGMGVTKAAADARSLAHALMAEPYVPAALRRFESERKPIGDLFVHRGRELGRFVAQMETGPDLVRSYIEAREALQLELKRSWPE